MKDNKTIHLWKGINWLPEKYQNLTGKFVLVINDIQNAIKLSLNNKVVFLTADKEHSTRYKTMIIGNEAFGKDDMLEVINEWKIEQVKQVLDKYDMFDVAIVYPPFDKNLHLKILETVVPHAEKVVNISPIGWLMDIPAKLGWKHKTTFNKYENSVSKHIEDLIVFDTNTANDCFNIALFVQLGVYTLNKHTASDYYKTIQDSRKDLNIFDKTVKRVYNNEVDNLAAHIQISTIHGNPGCADEFDVCTPSYKLMQDRRPANMTEAEFKNWHVSQNTKFMKYCNLLTRQGQHLCPAWLPYMGDYTQPWTDKKYCEYFGITGYISDTEAEPGSEWEIILSAMKKYC